jgi:hypothetical protein
MLENYRKGYRQALADGRAKTARRLEKKAARNASIDGDLIVEANAAEMPALLEAGWEIISSRSAALSVRYTMRRAGVDRVVQV